MNTEQLKQAALKATPGPWRWEFSEKGRHVYLVGGKKRYDLTVMDFVRWGMGGATMRLRDPAHDGMQLLYRIHERQDWIAPEPGREHHKNWHQLLTHPDAKLMELANPATILALLECVEALQSLCDDLGTCGATARGRSALQKLEAL